MHDQKEIQDILLKYGEPESITWLNDKILKILADRSSKDLFMAYSISNVKFDGSEPVNFEGEKNDTVNYFRTHYASLLQIARIYLLSAVLEQDLDFYTPKVATIIEVADTGELETFLKYLVLLPNPEAYKNTAVEALRTNIATVFDAIALNNPYPATYFDEQQWNQMYLKAAFMERDLGKIESIDQRANEDLARIISDYAHERWAAKRKVDPLFWRPVATFLNETLLNDIQRLFESDDVWENRAAVLCCIHSGNHKALELLNNYPEAKEEVETNNISWNTLKQ
ncbi:hypothetical protein SAMN04488009_1302 [Maribacter sedimenticola]|uniref:HEAT repeat domain-containing protein n=1 Tax=Maribacter sedimenticola TaxID=228956 RepID=A0ABY1SFS9_9FLAO|nr:EboA domain-containing protein [Maribacter sedimenticola]SNR38974.1 hypothetical protein SAMN04488009_1302 [Maribacter sedimenticola]